MRQNRFFQTELEVHPTRPTRIRVERLWQVVLVGVCPKQARKQHRPYTAVPHKSIVVIRPPPKPFQRSRQKPTHSKKKHREASFTTTGEGCDRKMVYARANRPGPPLTEVRRKNQAHNTMRACLQDHSQRYHPCRFASQNRAHGAHARKVQGSISATIACEEGIMK